jgi:hypothetical protein
MKRQQHFRFSRAASACAARHASKHPGPEQPVSTQIERPAFLFTYPVISDRHHVPIHLVSLLAPRTPSFSNACRAIRNSLKTQGKSIFLSLFNSMNYKLLRHTFPGSLAFSMFYKLGTGVYVAPGIPEPATNLQKNSVLQHANENRITRRRSRRAIILISSIEMRVSPNGSAAPLPVNYPPLVGPPREIVRALNLPTRSA